MIFKIRIVKRQKGNLRKQTAQYSCADGLPENFFQNIFRFKAFVSKAFKQTSKKIFCCADRLQGYEYTFALSTKDTPL